MVHLSRNPRKHKTLYNFYIRSAQRFPRWSSIVQMLYKCFAFTVIKRLVSNSTNISNFHPLEVVGRGSETQLQVGENLNYLI